MHNVYLPSYCQVSLYKAIEVKKQKLCHVGDYVAYKGEEEDLEEEEKVTLLLTVE